MSFHLWCLTYVRRKKSSTYLVFVVVWFIFFRLWLDFKHLSTAVTKTTCIWEFWPEPRKRSPLSWLDSRYTSGRRKKMKLIAEDKTIIGRLEGFIVHAGGRCSWYIYGTLWDQTMECYSLRNVASLLFRCLTSALLMLSSLVAAWRSKTLFHHYIKEFSFFQ